MSLVDFAIQLIIQDNPDIFPTPGLTPSTDPSQVIYRFEECEVAFNTPSVVIACQLLVCIRSTALLRRAREQNEFREWWRSPQRSV